jgi:hypothetical protein
MALQLAAMEMAEALALNDEEQVLMGTRRTLSALAVGGTRVLYRLYPLWVLGYRDAELPLHGFRSMRDAQALVAAHITQKIKAWRSGQPLKSTGSLSTTGTCPPHSWYLLSAFLVPAIRILGTCFPHFWYPLSAFLVPAVTCGRLRDPRRPKKKRRTMILPRTIFGR